MDSRQRDQRTGEQQEFHCQGKRILLEMKDNLGEVFKDPKHL